MGKRRDPFFLYDIWLHQRILELSHLIQEQFHVNRDTLIALSTTLNILAALGGMGCDLLSLYHEHSATAAEILKRRLVLYVMGGVYIWGGLEVFWMHKVASDAFEEDAANSWDVMRQMPSTVRKLMRATRRFFNFVATLGAYILVRTILTSFATDVDLSWADRAKLCVHLSFIMLTLEHHLIDSDHLHPDQRHAFDDGTIRAPR